jgi:diguanylate cyclase (GGDEF)-like protein
MLSRRSDAVRHVAADRRGGVDRRRSAADRRRLADERRAADQATVTEPGAIARDRSPWPVRLLLSALGAGVVVFAVSVFVVERSGEPSLWFDSVLQPVISVVAGLVIVGRGWFRIGERRAWMLIGLGFTLGNGLGDVAYVLARRHGWSQLIADGCYLGSYVFLLVGCVVLVRGRIERWSRTLLLDGIITSLGIASLTALVLLPSAFDAAGSTFDAENLSALAYPVVDIALVSVVVGAGWALARQLDRSLIWLGLAFLALAVSDVVYAFRVLRGSYDEGTVLELGFLLSSVGAAYAAWRRPLRADAPPRPDALGHRIMPVLPLVCAVIAIGVLSVGLFRPSWRGREAALGLALVALALTVWRLALAIREVRRLLQAREEARTDDLTGLRNRRALIERLGALSQRRGLPVQVSLLVLDLDGFKDVNDSMGHHAGDAILVEVSRRLDALARARGAELYRLGGDEFAMIVGDPSTDDTDDLARVIIQTVATPFLIDGRTIVLGVSVGLADSTEALTSDGDLLLRAADQAMYLAKRDRVGTARFRNDIPGVSSDLLEVATELRLADLDRDIRLHLQPKVRATTAAIEGVEALARYGTRSGTLLPTQLFIAMIDRIGRLPELTRAVMVQSLDWSRAWFSAGRALGISVNVTAADLADATFADFVEAELAARHLPPELLTVEVTENTILADIERSRATLARLRAVGVRVSLDDFGVGYSSLSHLRDLPFDEIKLDQSFTRDAQHDLRARSIVGATVELGHRLGASIVAEGIEDSAACELMRELGVDLFQGYYHSVPLPVVELWPGSEHPAAVDLAPRAGDLATAHVAFEL